MNELFIIIKDSLFGESSIIEKDTDKDFMLSMLKEIIETENKVKINSNSLPDNLMERKHGERYFYPLYKIKDSDDEYEIIRYSDGRNSYRIEILAW